MPDDPRAPSAAPDAPLHPPPGEAGDLTSADLEALDPHAPNKVGAPPWPSEPAHLVTQGLAFRWLDYGLYQLEKALVVTSLTMMALMMSLYTVYNNVIDERKLGVQVGAIALAALAGFTHTLVKGKPLHLRAGLAAAAAGAVTLLGWLVKTQHSRVVYFLFLALAVGGAAALWLKTPPADPALKAERRAVFLGLAAISPVMAYLFLDFPREFAVAEEYSKLLMFWVGFMGGSMATYHKAHLKIDFLRKLLKGRALHIHGFLSLAATAAITFVLFLLSYDYIFGKTGSFHHARTPGVIPDWIKVFSITVSLGIMSMRFFGQAIGELVTAIQGPAAPAARTSKPSEATP
jgi:TRAP-type C4-dicarboxylate transport system permease small subunit